MKPLQKRIFQRKAAELREERRSRRQRKAENPTEKRNLWRRTEKARRGLVHVFISRAALIIGLILLQILFLAISFQLLPQYTTHIEILYRVIGLLVVIAIVNEDGTDATKVTWMVFIMVLPIAGIAAYLYVRYDVGSRKIKKRLDSIRVDTASYLQQDPRVRRALHEDRPQMSGLSHYLMRQVGFPTYDRTTAAYFPTGEAFFESFIPELESAEHYIFLEFFIIDFGKLWDQVLAVLRRKAEEGVEVRLMYDGMNSLTKTPIAYWKQLNEMGIKCKVFNQVRPVVSSVQNNRDHRKICVIDGRVAYTGGVNIADEYVNERESFGYWKDAGIRFEGDAVRSFNVMFLQMWQVSEEQTEDMGVYLKAGRSGAKTANTVVPAARPADFVIPYGDSPFDHEDVGRTVYLYLIEHAKDYVHIMTPYLVLDKGVRRTLCQAAKCGVQIVIIMPHIPDKKYAYILAHSYYKELLSAGVQIYEYEKGFVHAKAWAVDDEIATVGTVNLDFRSLYWHFECGAVICDRETAMAVEADYQATLADCRKISMLDAEQRSWGEKIAGAFLRVIAPLM